MRTLVVGTPRSGTTWVGSVLGRTPGAGYVHEPDGIDGRPYTVKALRGLEGAPVLSPSDDAPAAYARMWDAAFGARVRAVPGQERVARMLDRATTPEERRAARTGRASLRVRMLSAVAVPYHLRPPVEHPVVKSVRATYALEWIVARWQPSVVVCFRHPLDVVASAIALGWDARDDMAAARLRPVPLARYAELGGEPPDPTDLGGCTAWWVGMQMSVLDDVARANPRFHCVDHATLCGDPVTQFRCLVDAVGLGWTPEIERYIDASDRPGSGYELRRVASEQHERWRGRLTPDQIRAAARVLARFPINRRYPVDELAG